MMTKPLYLAAMLTIAGCSTHYIKPGGSSEAFDRDYYDCLRDAAPVPQGYDHDRMVDRCLRVKGWHPQ